MQDCKRESEVQSASYRVYDRRAMQGVSTNMQERKSREPSHHKSFSVPSKTTIWGEDIFNPSL